MSKYSDYEEKVLSIIEKHGWQFTFVFDPEGLTPDFGYSVGFTTSLGAPEFIIFGLPRELMNSMLWEIHRQIKEGAIPTDGMRWNGLLEGFDCISRKATHKNLHSEYTTSANWLWQEKGNEGSAEVFQIVWPGAQQGLFPWDEGCAQDVIDAQPNLWLSE
ncbi:hypothetical protein PsW64_04728 [Pseudovibrio sp. W64]|uniref:DUF4262 domain-containing protein n=1 Tax=Pseudovibrio sp. W64 TaxID=1735583 RepID=UPI0007AED994|nr:DUF4262 domain-containing protein [Pseudovibrio sp. W64]KZK76883.1 hypothetical protein PsW64_04728 [Pseudovibrio sp. W64]